MNHNVLSCALEEGYGLRNIREDWIRRQRALSLDIVKGPITRTNLCNISTGTLPWNILEAHSIQLGVKALVQVEDIINIANANPRSHEAPRVLQLALNDGAIDFAAVELEPLGRRLSMKTIPGTKIVLLPSTYVRRGRVLLTPSDFIFFGSPPTNLWGEHHELRIAQSLRDAGLPNPQASSFDSIARPQTSNGANARIPVDMGGIADAIITNENDEDDDDMFWAQAVEVADRNVENVRTRAPNTISLDNSPTQRSPDMREATLRRKMGPQLIDLEAATPQTEVTGIEAGMELEQTRTEPTRNVTREKDMSMIDYATSEVLEIPNTPVFESDERRYDPPYEDEEKSRVIVVPSQDAILSMLDPPLIPFSKLVAVGKDQGHSDPLYRVYSMKTGKKTNIKHDGAQYSFFVEVDDGTAIDMLTINADVFGRLTGFTAGSDEFRQDEEDGFPLARKAIRGIHGFVRVGGEQDGRRITGISQGIPDDVVSTNTNFSERQSRPAVDTIFTS
ncbi:RecQ mediated genome instability protein [Gracilaria domingensis]|nr:RecQ mediated genome instability protein [Gracilaria domingensis]